MADYLPNKQKINKILFLDNFFSSSSIVEVYFSPKLFFSFLFIFLPRGGNGFVFSRKRELYFLFISPFYLFIFFPFLSILLNSEFLLDIKYLGSKDCFSSTN